MLHGRSSSDFIDRMDADRQEEKGTTETGARAEIYAAEAQKSTFCREQTAVF